MSEDLKSAAKDPVVTLHGKDYPMSTLPQDVRNLIEVHGLWQEETKKAKIEVFKLEAAIRGIEAEIEIRINQIENTPQV